MRLIHALSMMFLVTSLVAVDALIVGIETQDRYLGNKKTWTRKMVLLTDGENPIEVEDWEATADKMNSLKIKSVFLYVSYAVNIMARLTI